MTPTPVADSTGPSSAYLIRWSFLRLLGLIYLIAFLSYWAQIDGLLGSQGILPIEPVLEAVSERMGPERFFLFPTLLWIDASDITLSLTCASGVLLALLLIAGVAPAPCSAALWALYLSLVTPGRTFFSFQWDNLLLEAGLLSIFVAPLGFRPSLATEGPPSGTVLWLLRWLLFRLMFLSGVVKLMSGDATWRSLRALEYHYQTQPLPTVPGWFAHQLPGGFQTISVATMFLIELVLPFFIFAPGKWRRIAFAGFVLLQGLIAATGNYAFFNLLALALCVLLLDDSVVPRRWRTLTPGEKPGKAWPRAVTAPLAALVILVSGMQCVNAFLPSLRWPSPLLTLYGWTAPFRSINSYGLFAVMTTRRPEILVEGSRDGETWLPYEFRWKPGNLKRRPLWAAPHQPRLDWQMWFAALGSYRDSPWFAAFLRRLLEGSPSVLGLLETNPFPDEPPRFVRAVLYEYRFTDTATWRETGAWWEREPLGLYAPPMSLPPRN